MLKNGFQICLIREEDYIKMGYLIAETTREEREKIVRDSLGNISANCDGCMAGLADMYQDYIEGKKELRQINMEFHARYVKDDDRLDRSEEASQMGCFGVKTVHITRKPQ